MIDRKTYIGGSDASTINLQNSYEAYYELWMKKTGRVEDNIESHHLERGNFLEPVIEKTVREFYDPTINSDAVYEEFGAEKGKQIFLTHPEYNFVGGHADAIGVDTVWDFKAPAMYNLENYVKNGINPNWYYQVQHYMMLAGRVKGAIAMFDYDNWDVHVVRFKADPELQDSMLERYKDFWMDVQMDIPPIATSAEELEQIEILHDEDLEKTLSDYKKWYDLRYVSKEKQNAARIKILSVAGDKKKLITDSFVASIAEVEKDWGSYTRLTVKERLT